MVYVDELRGCLPNDHWHHEQSCHLVADAESELCLFAEKIGLRLEWFQRNPRLPHFDLTANMRRKAVKAGAIEIDRRQLVKMMRKA